ncbi:MAG: class I SAM-dependent methyltransferase [Pedobacter sp.]|nr:MAG: class I SAM-dependent methyltransferase [Pedobacter sp.]
MLSRILSKLGYVKRTEFLKENFILPKDKITYSNDLLYTYHNADFLDDPHFKESYQLGKDTDKETLLKNYDIQWRIHVLCWAANHAMKLDGDFVDCGVHTGIFARAIINYVSFEKCDKKYYLLDTFEGLDAKYSSSKELLRNSQMGYDKDDSNMLFTDVQETFKPFKTKIIKGSIPETLAQVDTEKVSFLSIDMNCVYPEICALNFFWDKIVSGGLIVLDDYGYNNEHNDQKKAHDAFAKTKNIEILTLPTCQGLIIKP